MNNDATIAILKNLFFTAVRMVGLNAIIPSPFRTVRSLQILMDHFEQAAADQRLYIRRGQYDVVLRKDKRGSMSGWHEETYRGRVDVNRLPIRRICNGMKFNAGHFYNCPYRLNKPPVNRRLQPGRSVLLGFSHQKCTRRRRPGICPSGPTWGRDAGDNDFQNSRFAANRQSKTDPELTAVAVISITLRNSVAGNE
jgi:hypothetical protein